MISAVAGLVGLMGARISVGAVNVKTDQTPSDSRCSSDHEKQADETDGAEEGETPDTSLKSENSTSEESKSGQKELLQPGKVVGGVAVTGPLAEGARRVGIDRHTESGLAERLHAKTYADRVRGTVADEGTTVFAPDGPEGIDKRIVTETGERTIQSKHFGRPVGESVLEEYENVDVLASTNGFPEEVNPEEYGTEPLTYSDWPLRRKARLEGERILRGIQRGGRWLTDWIRDLAGKTARGARRVASRILRVGKDITGRLWNLTKVVASHIFSRGEAAVSRFLRLRIKKQLLIILGLVTISHLLWRWYRDDDAETGEDTEPAGE